MNLMSFQTAKRRQTILLAEDDGDAVLLLKMACARSRLINPIQVVGDGGQVIAYLGSIFRRRKPESNSVFRSCASRTGFSVLSFMC